MGSHWMEAFRYHRWANLHLLDVCARLSAEQLELTTPGTYGTVSATLMHMAGAEQRYVARLTDGEPAYSEKDGFPGVQPLADLITKSTDRLTELSESMGPNPDFTAKFRDAVYRLEPGVIFVQALHHGNDHRTHICTIFGAHGIEYGDMDVWAYGEATGSLAKVSG